MKPGCGRQSFIVVFDFDHTVVDCNTDEVIPAHLGRRELQKRMIVENNILNANYGHDDADAAKTSAGDAAPSSPATAMRKLQWTRLMDTLIAPFSRAELDAAARETVTIAPGMRDVFDFLLAAQEKNRFAGASESSPDGLRVPNYLEVGIASDSNLQFIVSALDATMPGVRERISQIHSNPYYELADAAASAPALTAEEAADEAARDAKYNPDMAARKSRVMWYERTGNHCNFCGVRGNKPNMCKSRIIKRILNTTTLVDPTIIFVGDGGNDYCPVLNALRPRDFVFARTGFPLHRMLSTGSGGERGMATDEKIGGCCSIGLWQDAQELLQLFRAVIEELPFQRLPSLVRFLDVSKTEEFRAVTLRRRMANIVERTMKENAGRATPAGLAAMERVKRSIEENGAVPPLPGQHVVPAWLRAYAYTYESGRSSNSTAADRAMLRDESYDGRPAEVRVAPRWGQLPWLHGEIYLYHLLWQWLLLKDEAAGAAATPAEAEAEAGEGGSGPAQPLTGLPNYISPYDILNPLYSQDGGATVATQGMVSAHDPAIACQDLESAFLATEPAGTEAGTIARVIYFRDGDRDGAATEVLSEVVPFRALTDPAGNSLLGCGGPADPAAGKFFLPYHDIYEREKRDVLVSFVEARVVPMLAARPWAAPRRFAQTLLSWMLWGNGLDLSMFTMDQLKDAHAEEKGGKKGAAAGGKGKKKAKKMTRREKRRARKAEVARLRDEESAAAEAQSVNIVGNQSEKVARYLRLLLQGPVVAGGSIEKKKKKKSTKTAAKKSKKKVKKAKKVVHRDAAVATTGEKEGASTALPHVTAKSVHRSQFCVDVVNDNVGVECIADLCFGLWFLQHARRKHAATLAALAARQEAEKEGKKGGAKAATEKLMAELAAVQPTVTFHVKPQPYYVSDVTPRDFEKTLAMLEETYTSATTTTTTTAKQRKALRAVLAPFVRRVRAAFRDGGFVVDADTVWTQPCEYRELPPRVVNRYFYTQTCAAPTAAEKTAEKKPVPNLSAGLKSRRAVFMANKAAIDPKTALVIFKGDLNFRRVVGDRFWERSDYLTTLCAADADLATAAGRYTAEQKAAVAEVLLDTPAANVVDAPSFCQIVSAYWPVAAVPVVSIRTIKSEGCVGVTGEKKRQLDEAHGREWRISGSYGVILFAR